jgi:putative flippase GtrA
MSQGLDRASARKQFFRYALIGLASNALLYGAYLALTLVGMEPKLAMTVLYAAGIAQTFVFNRRWTFRHGGSRGPAFARYCAAYALGYVVNFLALLLLVDRLGYAHQLVQGVMVVLLALALFALQKFWVFRSASAVPPDAIGP